MKNNLYKYSPPDIFDMMVEANTFKLKCSYPKNYNDPYELFLTINPEEYSPHHIAYYHEILSEIPQFPTTCFSRSPIVIPMWAHYARDHSGYVIEINEEAISSICPQTTIKDVTYSDKTGEVDMQFIVYACGTAKPRHTLAAMRVAFNTAYFTKNNCWEYEQERRVILKEANIILQEDTMLINLPTEAIKSIIVGAKSDDALKQKCLDYSSKHGFEFRQMIIGKSSCVPYFLDKHDNTLIFENYEIKSPIKVCSICNEPLKANSSSSKCHWCSIDENFKDYAATRNPFRMLDHLGLLEGYLKTS